MPVLRHAFTSPKSDGADSTLLQPSNWNASHIGSAADSPRIWVPGTNAYGLDDEFDDASLAGAWTRVDRSGNAGAVSWAEGNGVLSMLHTSAADNNSEIHALLKPLTGQTFPLTVETAIMALAPNANYLMAGLVLADGTTYGAGNQMFVMPYSYSGTAGVLMLLDTRAYTGFNTDSGTSGSGYGMNGGPLYVRIRWTAANTFSTDYSSDGVQWMTQRSGQSKTMTPTYVGFGVSSWGGAVASMASFQYFRVY